MNVISNREGINRKRFYKSYSSIITFLFSGVLTGIMIKLFDMYAGEIGNIFFRISVWIFLCTTISIRSKTSLKAAVNVFSYCISMLAGYYVMADCTNNVYSLTFVYGWFLVSLGSPFMSFCVWYTKGRGIVSKVLSVCIIVCMELLAILLYDKIRISDIILALATGILDRKSVV